MNMDCFLKRYVDFLMNDKDDAVFQNIQMLTGGTTSVRIAKLLNFAVSQMDATECYVEVGTYTGCTLCSAEYANGKNCIGIDSYTPEAMKEMTQMSSEDVKNRCQLNINVMGRGMIRLIPKDFRKVTKEEIGSPIAVAFIDGKHDFTSVMEQLYWQEPMLADQAVIVLDDANYIEVSLAIEKWMGLRAPNYDLLAYIKPYYGEYGINTASVRDRFMNNGVCVIRYHKDPTSNTFSYDPAKMNWTKEELEEGKKGELVNAN